MISSIILLVSHHVFAGVFKLYKKAWQYASVNELTNIFYAVTCSIVLTALMQAILFTNVSLRTLVITWMMHVLLIGGSR